VILNFVAVGNVFPVVFNDMPKLNGQSCHKNYDCHYVPFVPKDMNNPKEVT